MTCTVTLTAADAAVLGKWTVTDPAARVWADAGADLEGFAGTTAADCLGELDVAVRRLKQTPLVYADLAPSPHNLGVWADHLAGMKSKFAQHPDASVAVTR